MCAQDFYKDVSLTRLTLLSLPVGFCSLEAGWVVCPESQIDWSWCTTRFKSANKRGCDWCTHSRVQNPNHAVDDEIPIDPLRHSVSYLPTPTTGTTLCQVRRCTIDCFIWEGLIEIRPKWSTLFVVCLLSHLLASSPKTRIVIFSLSWNNEHLTQHILKQSYLTWTFRDRAGRAGFRQKNGYGYWKNVLVSVRFSQVAWHKWYIFYLCVEQFIFIIYTVHVHHHC